MAKPTRYYVFNNGEFAKVNEEEYLRWLNEKWNTSQPPMCSKLIGGIIYTIQTFYHGDVTKGSKFIPFTVFYLEGNKHKIRCFQKWIAFKCYYDKLIAKLEKTEIRHFSIKKYRGNKAPDQISIAAMATIRG